MKKVTAFLLIVVFIGSALFSCSVSDLQYYTAKERTPDSANLDLLYFSLPVAICHDEDDLFILDSQDNEIRVFSKSGAFRYAIGKKGQGPGEFDMPSSMDISGERIYISDGGNGRIQILDKKGVYHGGFKVLFWPHEILVLSKENIVVSHLPLKKSFKEKMVHCFNEKGKLLWEAFDSYLSEDAVYDTIRNLIFLKKSTGGQFFLMRRNNDRLIYHMSRSGDVIGQIELSKNYPLKKISIPTKRKKELTVFCWTLDLAGDEFFMLIPEYTEDGDLGSGKQIAIVTMEGKIRGYIDLPERLNKFVVDADSIYGIDPDYRLRIFTIVKK
ncbi:MAG: 6-bladed beta-propeller [Candidatus Aminicenantes bacterium]|nr:6-bladed beta-propeller [Candidatus Aminicenantes bacterium]